MGSRIAVLIAIVTGSRLEGASQDVTVCMEMGSDNMISYQAQLIAAKMFKGAGVHIDWHTYRGCPRRKLNDGEPAEIVRISLAGGTPKDFLPGALAYALPYEGVHIQVFYDRVQTSVESPTVATLLAHVLVHEITHILQGINRHSETGVMKAHWDVEDREDMRWKPLGFTKEDVWLIQLGIEKRTARLAAQDSGSFVK